VPSLFTPLHIPNRFFWFHPKTPARLSHTRLVGKQTDAEPYLYTVESSMCRYLRQRSWHIQTGLVHWRPMQLCKAQCHPKQFSSSNNRFFAASSAAGRCSRAVQQAGTAAPTSSRGRHQRLAATQPQRSPLDSDDYDDVEHDVILAKCESWSAAMLGVSVAGSVCSQR
jgi:hypothetical protein